MAGELQKHLKELTELSIGELEERLDKAEEDEEFYPANLYSMMWEHYGLLDSQLIQEVINQKKELAK